jgi:hypothetical protein
VDSSEVTVEVKFTQEAHLPQFVYREFAGSASRDFFHTMNLDRFRTARPYKDEAKSVRGAAKVVRRFSITD